jgi:putative transposase
MAESVIGLYKRECVRHDGPFRTVDELELATLSWIDWWNRDRLHGELGHIPPIEFETEHYRRINPQQHPLLGQPSLH